MTKELEKPVEREVEPEQPPAYELDSDTKEPGKYVAVLQIGRHPEKWFQSPYFSHAVAGAAALIEEVLMKFKFPDLEKVTLKIYHLGGANQEKHLVTEIKIENHEKWHPAGQGPKIAEPEEATQNV